MNSTASDSFPIDELEARLREAEETLNAIRNGEVDALIVGPEGRQQVYTLESADRPYRVLIEQIQEGAVTLAADGTILYCNRRFAEMLAAPQEQVIGNSIGRFIPAQQNERFKQLLIDSSAGGGKAEFELTTGDGSTLPAYLSFVELAHEPNRVICGIAMDLTRQKQAERRRRAAEESLQIALDAADMGHWDVDLVAGTMRRSTRCDAIFGYDPQQPWDREIFLNHVHPEDREAVAERLEPTGEGHRLELECRIKRSDDGATRWIRINGKIYYEDGRLVRAAGVVADITARRQLEEQLHQAQKMEAVGQLTGGLAHDFNNLLAVIVSSLGIAQRRVSASDPMLARHLGHAERAAQRGAALTHQLLSFSRRQSLLPRTVCINELLRNLEPLIQRAVGEEIDVQVDLEGGNWHCQVDPNQLESALLNLAINARDAIAGSGTLRVEVGDAELAPADVESMPDASSNSYVRLSVVDTGSGMAPDVQAKVFEPFFTTKETGRGSGLGLSMVYGFVKQSKGHIAIESEIGRGTAVHLYLPRAEPAATVTTSDPEQSGVESKSATVLVVEDDPHVRPMVVELVRDIGHTVIEAANGADAIELIDKRRDIDLLFTDVVMPGDMNGIELAREAHRRRPQMAVLLTSGFAGECIGHGRLEDKRFGIIQKPYERTELVRAINAALAEARGQVSRA
ncbi:MAG TPA: PAS domain S-box protein [Gammaproteobacteria bacterium]|nr:PAS domain S-box protein [Gammaproteobacteria bacterium]